MNAVTAHVMISSEGELTCRAMSADTMKMPEPIIEPMTMAVELGRPSPRINSAPGLAFCSIRPAVACAHHHAGANYDCHGCKRMNTENRFRPITAQTQSSQSSP